MLKLIVTDAGVSKGYDGAPALRFIDLEGGGQNVRFRIGKRVYDSRCENNHRWINLSVKAFGEVCERIKKMKLKEGSFVNIIGRYDEESWEDQTTHEKKTAPVLIVDEIEYCYSGSGQKNGQENGASAASAGAAGAGTPSTPPQQTPQGQPQGSGQASETMPENFTGFENFGGVTNPFF